MNELNNIVTQAQNGDPAAFEILVMRFQDMALRYALSFLNDFQLSQDAVQEAFIRTLTDLPSLRSPEAFVSWFRCIVFSCCNRFTRKHSAYTVEIDDKMLQSPNPNPLDQLEAREKETIISKAIHTLPVEECQIMTLFYFGEYSHSEIANFLDLSTYTVNNRLRRARKRIKSQITKQAPNTILRNMGRRI
jgi:RNA polymerase sigma-70 factor (ECF subfamily)